jgi:hypothetical protein
MYGGTYGGTAGRHVARTSHPSPRSAFIDGKTDRIAALHARKPGQPHPLSTAVPTCGTP